MSLVSTQPHPTLHRNHPWSADALPAMLRKIKQILTGKEKKRAGLIAGLDVLMALLDIAFLAWLMLLVSRYTQPGKPAGLRFFSGRLIQIPVWLFLILYLLKNAAAYAAGAAAHRFFAEVSTRLSRLQLSDYFQGDADNFNQTDASVFVRRISQQPVEFSTYILANAQAVFSQSVLALCALAAILLYHPAMLLVLLVILIPPLTWMGWMLRTRLRTIRYETKRVAEKAIQYLHESLGAYIEANVYGKTGFFVRRYTGQQQQLNHNIARQQTLQALPSRLLEGIAVAAFFLLAALQGRVGGGAQPEWLILGIFLGAAWKILPAVVKILNSSGQMKTYAFILPDLLPASGVADLDGTGIKTGKPAHEDKKQKQKRQKIESPPRRIKAVSIRQIRFTYGAGKPELKADVQLHAGDLVALTGRSGTGKTTLLQLISGFLQPQEGRIVIHHSAGEESSPAAGAAAVAYVKQQPFLLNDNLEKNLSLSDTETDTEKINRLAALCGLNWWPDVNGPVAEQLITENGRNISGGQRQRIALARALCHDPQLLLLDEPFSQLDEAAEMEMMQLLSTLAATGMIILIATHSSAAAAHCHSTISLDESVYA